MDDLISTRRPDLITINKKKKNEYLHTVEHRIKLKESEKKDKFPDLARELK